MHGFNPANPVYWKWWSADSRHAVDNEFGNHQGVIYMEPHGRGNVQYMGFADSDILRGIAEAKRLFNVDEDRVYLTGDSMGGWGTWNVSTRHPELFAAIAPVFGGVDYHATQTEEELAKLTPMTRFFNEKQSTWAQAESLINTPIFVHHGDQDEAVNVDWSRWAVRMLQRWGYDVRYQEYPGRVHEALTTEQRSDEHRVVSRAHSAIRIRARCASGPPNCAMRLPGGRAYSRSRSHCSSRSSTRRSWIAT